MATFSVMSDVPNPIIVDAAGTAGSGYVLKAFLPGTTTSTSIAIDGDGSSPQTSITANAEGKWEVTGNEILPYIDRTHKWGIFANATDATANTPFYMGPFDNVEKVSTVSTASGNTPWDIWDTGNTYDIPDIITGSDDNYYRSLTDSNQGNDPTSDAVNWEKLELGRIWNTNVTYGLGDSAYGSDGLLYFSLVASNTGTNPTTETTSTKWRGSDQIRSATGGGTVDAITATYIPAVGALKDGLWLRLRSAGANTSTTPTFEPNGVPAKTIVKNGNQALSAGDIGAAGHEVIFAFSTTNDKWELLNPASSNTATTIQVFTADGTWTKPAGIIAVKVTLCGGGGAGGGAIDSETTGPGAAGGTGIEYIPDSALSATETVTIGAGGVGVSAGNGGAGGTTSFGSLLSATGGAGGGGTDSLDDGAAGGIGSGGDINIAGGGAGGSSDTSVRIPTAGGASFFGGGSQGVNDKNGVNAVAPGSGGGAIRNNSSTNRTGADGADGIIIVEEFY